MANVLAVRIDGLAYKAALLEYLDKDGGAYLVVQELESENPHFHVVVHTSKKTPAFRMGLKRAIGVMGNGEYSCAEVRDLSKYERYMLKGEQHAVHPVVVGAKGMTYQDVSWQEERHDAYWSENEALTRKRKAEPILDVVYDMCKKEAVCWDRRDRIAEIYIRQCVDRNKSINIFQIKSQVNLLQCKLCPDDSALESLARDV